MLSSLLGRSFAWIHPYEFVELVDLPLFHEVNSEFIGAANAFGANVYIWQLQVASVMR